MRTPRVMVVAYDAGWKAAFAQIKAELQAALGDLALAIEHVGSTAVEGLPAKPCIDLDVVIRDMDTFGAVAEKLEAIGYFHEGDLGIRGREAFGYSGKTHLMKHHLYVCPRDSKELHRHLVFRDQLRQDPEAVREYGAIKLAAAGLYPEDIDGYIRHKAPCIEKLYRRWNL